MSIAVDETPVGGGVRIIDRSLPQTFQGVAVVVQRDPHPTLGHGIHLDQAVERAHVMAASFDMLEALESFPGFLAGMASYEAWEKKARTAIAKAKGQ